MTAVLTFEDLAAVSDHDVLLGGIADGVAENRAAAQRWLRLVTFYRRRVGDDGVRYANAPNFHLTARDHTVVEISSLWGMSAGRMCSQLNTALGLSEHFEFLWQLCLEGRCDTYRATVVAEAARHQLTTDAERACLARRLEPFFRRHLTQTPGLEELCGVDTVVTCTLKQLRNKLNYEIRRLRSSDAEKRFRDAHEDRHVETHDGEDGISWLTLSATTDKVTLIRNRLTLAAKQKRAAGDPRTLDQLCSDLAVELLTGCMEGVLLPTYARPVVNLTVPIQTVMGISDCPGTLSGGVVIPAGLARVIAQSEGATWHRMLTDPAGRMVELSTTSYQPTKAIWEEVVAEYGTCFGPGCDSPATEAEIDHRVRWPEGATTPANLWPGCRRDHKAKHAPGFSISQTETGSFAITTPAGFTHQLQPTLHPVSEEWPEVGIQHSATELIDGLAYLKELRDDCTLEEWDLHWEHDSGNWEKNLIEVS